MSGRPAYVDEHARLLPGVAPERAYAAARSYAERLVRPPGPVTRVVTLLLGTDPASGFALADEQPPRLVSLSGRHRFSHYVMDLRVDPAPDGTGSTVTVVTWADFPGLQGRLYRAAVIGSRGHVLAVRRMLAAVAAVA